MLPTIQRRCRGKGTAMHLKPDADITKFLLTVKHCQSDVFYESDEGDVLNLASTLSQYVFCSIAGQPELWRHGMIRCESEADYAALKDFLTVCK